MWRRAVAKHLDVVRPQRSCLAVGRLRRSLAPCSTDLKTTQARGEWCWWPGPTWAGGQPGRSIA